MSKKTDLFELFGIDKESFEKSKDILPTFKIGEIEPGAKVVLQFLESLPRIIEVESKFDDNEKTSVAVINVFVESITRPDTDGTIIDVPIGKSMSLFLSSKSLNMGILKVYEPNKTLESIKVQIDIGLTTYKKYGENRVYNVVQL